MASIMKIAFGATWFILASLLTYKLWYTVDIFRGFMELDLIRIIFYTGLVITWLLVELVVPAYIIIDGYNE